MRTAEAPIVVAGMHRSGTSLVASWIEALGIDVGPALLAADSANPRGYFEDRDFVELHQRMLWDATPADDGGHRDWGWTEHGVLDRAAIARHRPDAERLVEQRRARAKAWGWKDPRTSLLLDFWHELLPEARYVFVYRRPWDVADSMERLGAEVFIGRPDYAFSIWNAYNRALLAFQDAHPDRCLLLSVHALAAAPSATVSALAESLGAPRAAAMERAAARLETSLLQTRDPDDPLVRLDRDLHSDAMALLAELDSRAAVPAPTPVHRPFVAVAAPSAPQVSVVIPYHDDRELILQALASVERSVPVPHEILVVNDGSTESSSLHVLDFLRQRGVRVVDQAQAGLGEARNTGIRSASGPFVLPLDSDNRLLPGFVVPALEALRADPRAAAAYGHRREFGLRNQLIEVPEPDAFALLQGNYIDACALVRRSAWEECGGYNGTNSGWEDWDLWLSALERGWRLVRVPVPAFEYRVRPSSMSALLMEPATGRRWQTHLVRKNEELYRRFLPELLERAQEAKRLEDRNRDLPALREELAALRAWATAHTRECAAANTHLDAERLRLEAENAALAAEIERWRARTAAMEGTRAWRWRAAFLRLRTALDSKIPPS